MRCPRPLAVAAAAAVLLLGALPADAEQVFRVVSVYDGGSLRTREHGRIRFLAGGATLAEARAKFLPFAKKQD